MIEKTTGTVAFPAWSGCLHPTMTREMFLKSALSQGSKINVKNEPWCSWWLLPVEWKAMKWYVVVYFHGTQLHMIEISAGSPAFGTSWDDWSEEKEVQRKQIHDDLLSEELGPPPYEFPWGSAVSVLDLKNGTSSIILKLR